MLPKKEQEVRIPSSCESTSLLTVHLSLFFSALEAAFDSCNAIDVINFFLKMEHKQR